MSLENLSTRVNYYGTNTKSRMETDKLRSLKAALKNSYQRQTAVLQDGREFFCLINPDKLKNDYDDKIISMDSRWSGYSVVALPHHRGLA